VTAVFLRFLDHKRFADLGFRWPDGGRARALRQAVQVPLATLGVLALWLAVMAAAADLRLHGFSQEWRHGVAGWPIPPPLLLGLLLLGFLIQGGVEEWLVRGYIFRTLRDRSSFPVAGLASSSLFAALHLANPSATAVSTVNTLLAGLVLAELVERSGSLWGAVLGHGVWNFAIGCLISLPVSGIAIFKLLDVELKGPAPLTGGGYGPEASAVLTAIAVPLAVVLWPRRQEKSAAPAADREIEEVRPGVVAGDVQGEVTGVDPGEVEIGQQ
jgi:membrane protease YdiL (CAAX protease family)